MGQRDILTTPEDEPQGEGRPIGKRWALLVGVNTYDDPRIPVLKYCNNDVRDLGNVLERAGYEVWRFFDHASEGFRRPNRNNIRAGLAQIQTLMDEDDLLLVHFSCHGKLHEDEALLITSDTHLDSLSEQGLPLAELKQTLARRRKVILTLDVCHGGIGRSLPDPNFIRHVYDLAEGFSILTACTLQQEAHECADLGHGLFSHYLIEGLAGAADRSGKQYITVYDLSIYVLAAQRAWSLRHGGKLQDPTNSLQGIGDLIAVDRRGTAQEATLPDVHVHTVEMICGKLALLWQFAGGSYTLEMRNIGEHELTLIKIRLDLPASLFMSERLFRQARLPAGASQLTDQFSWHRSSQQAAGTVQVQVSYCSSQQRGLVQITDTFTIP